MKKRLPGEGALSSIIIKYFGKSGNGIRMLPLREVLSAYPGAIFLLLITLFVGSALYFFLTEQMIPGVIISTIGILLLSGNVYRNRIPRK